MNVKHGYEYSSNFEGNMLFDDLASEAKIYQKGGLSYYDEKHGINLSNLYFLCVCGWIKVAMIFQLLLTSQILPFSSLDHLSFFCVNKQQHYNHVCCVTGKSFPTLLHQFVNIG